MKKSRNSFFAESSYQAYNPTVTPNMQPAPFETASNYYYQGPVPIPAQSQLPNNYTTQISSNDIENRLAKIERQINRIDYRLSKLENHNNIITPDDFDNNNSNMYML